MIKKVDTQLHQYLKQLKMWSTSKNIRKSFAEFTKRLNDSKDIMDT